MIQMKNNKLFLVMLKANLKILMLIKVGCLKNLKIKILIFKILKHTKIKFKIILIFKITKTKIVLTVFKKN
jgi:hypothetical protein